MAFTSNWEWLSIRRTTQQSYSGTALLRRREWRLVRKRVSDEAYTSEVDTTQNSLSGYNGGVTETISCPTTNFVSFTSISSDCNFAKAGDKWVERGFLENGYPTYAPWNTTLTNIYRLEADAIPAYVLSTKRQTGTTNWKWGIAVVSQSFFAAGNAVDYWASVGAAIQETTGSSSIRNVNGRVLNDENGSGYWDGSFSGSATTVLNTNGQLGFYCTGDEQRYDQMKVDWYSQFQTWEYKEPWRVE